MGDKKRGSAFSDLVKAIRKIHEQCAAHAGRAVNVSLTLRNWVIGRHISEFEMNGADRAIYGEQLFKALSTELRKVGVGGSGPRQLYGFLAFYRAYPKILRSASAEFLDLVPGSAIQPKVERKVRTVSAQLEVDVRDLLSKLSYSHFELLVAIGEPIKRTFYEIECLRGNWSVRELKRQIGSLYFERSGLSKNKAKLAELVHSSTEAASSETAVRDPYVFEFLGIKPQEVMGESDLENALLDKIQDFLLELGHGFCFEARQKRILIGNTFGFVDLVFYHRVLKCHVLVELKVAAFSHEHLGQLNTYVSWYGQNMMSKGDNLPIGLLLCTHKDHALVEYALAGMKSRLFVSKYQLELPKKEDIERFLERQIKEVF
jgi:predicted nuclease of restriction endonuclease-like (RecB) superfamily